MSGQIIPATFIVWLTARIYRLPTIIEPRPRSDRGRNANTIDDEAPGERSERPVEEKSIGVVCCPTTERNNPRALLVVEPS